MKAASSNEVVSGNIRWLRQAKGWSQEQLAEKCALHRTYIGAIERGEGNITLDTLDRIATALDCPAARLFETAARR